MGKARAYHGSVYSLGGVYIFGGNGLNTAEMFRNRAWIDIAPMKKKRKGLSVVPRKG